MSTTHHSPDELAAAHAHTEAELASQARRPKRLKSEVTVAIQTWATRIKSSRQSLLNVQLSQRGKLRPAYTYLLKELETSGNTFNTREDILDSIIQRMIEEKIVIPDHPSIANEWRR